MPLSYTNRHGKTNYIKAVSTKKGKFRYYITMSDKADNLIKEIPDGYEIVELPEDSRVVIRKIKTIFTTEQESKTLEELISSYSNIRDFFIHAEGEYLSVFHSQFNNEGGQFENLSRKEAIKIFGNSVDKFIKFDSSLRFKLVDKKQRLFQAERVINMSYYNFDFNEIGEIDSLENLAKEFGQHLGKATFYHIAPNSELS